MWKSAFDNSIGLSWLCSFRKIIFSRRLWSIRFRSNSCVSQVKKNVSVVSNSAPRAPSGEPDSSSTRIARVELIAIFEWHDLSWVHLARVQFDWGHLTLDVSSLSFSTSSFVWRGGAFEAKSIIMKTPDLKKSCTLWYGPRLFSSSRLTLITVV